MIMGLARGANLPAQATLRGSCVALLFCPALLTRRRGPAHTAPQPQKRVEKLKVKKNKQLEQDKKTREKERIKEESLRARPASNVVSNGVVA